MNTRGSARKTQFSTLKQIVASENLVEELKLERFNQVREAVQDMGNPQVAISQTPEIDDVTDDTEKMSYTPSSRTSLTSDAQSSSRSTTPSSSRLSASAPVELSYKDLRLAATSSPARRTRSKTSFNSTLGRGLVPVVEVPTLAQLKEQEKARAAREKRGRLHTPSKIRPMVEVPTLDAYPKEHNTTQQSDSPSPLHRRSKKSKKIPAAVLLEDDEVADDEGLNYLIEEAVEQQAESSHQTRRWSLYLLAFIAFCASFLAAPGILVAARTLLDGPSRLERPPSHRQVET